LAYKSRLIGRAAERASLLQAWQQASAGRGELLLVGGEAGMGKSRLVEEILGNSAELYLHYGCYELRTPTFAPIASILRQYMNRTAVELAEVGPLANYLNLLLPELGPSPEDSGDHTALMEAIARALTRLAGDQPAVIVIDDLQWADNATLDTILSLVNYLPNLPILMVGVYRSDEIPRGHPLRWLRNQLRRSRATQELTVMPLDESATASLAEAVLGEKIAPALASLLHRRSEGVPLFVEQLVVALKTEERLRIGDRGLQLADDHDLPLPETIRDVILLRLDRLTEEAREFAEVAAVMGERFSLVRVIDLAGGDDGLDQLIEQQLLLEGPDQETAFNHALTREVIYREIPWTRRRNLHRAVAKQLTEDGAPAETVASHWLEAQDIDQARLALASAAQHACQIHAYRDAASFGNHALRLWPDGQDEDARIAVVEQYGNCAQLSGMLSEAARAWREAAAKRQQMGQTGEYAATQRRLASVLELQGAWTQAITARANSAKSFMQVRLTAEAATEYLALASTLHLQGQFSQALQYAEEAEKAAGKAERQDLEWQANGLKGRLLAKLGQVDKGLEAARKALTAALDASDSNTAVANFLNLAGALEQSSDYVASRAAYEEAIGYCNTQGIASSEQVCLGCMAFVLWHLGDWDEALEVARDVLQSDEAPTIMKQACSQLLGRERLFRGDVDSAEPLIQSALVYARSINYFNMVLESEQHMAMIAAQRNQSEAVMAHWRQALEAWRNAEDLHYGIGVFRWGATYFAMKGDSEQVQQATSALNQIVIRMSNAEALAGLAHALGESLLMEGNANKSISQFEQAVTMIEQVQVPYSKAQSLWRLGAALVEAGDLEKALERLNGAYAIFKELGASIDYQSIEKLLVALGQSNTLTKDNDTIERMRRAGLTTRQIEVLQKLAAGMTNREIAEELVLSPRTVEMHVANVLNKLGCANRTEAVARAAQLGLL